MITLTAILLLAPTPSFAAVANDANVSAPNAPDELDEAERLMDLAVELSASEDASRRKESLPKYRAAHEAYLRVLAGDPNDKHIARAARGQMEALRGALEYDETSGSSRACSLDTAGQCRQPGKDKPPTATEFDVTPYSAGEAEMLTAYDVYEQHIHDPSGPQQATIRYHRCKLMVAHNRFDEVTPKLEALIGDFDGTIHAAWASEMLIDVLTIRWTQPGNTPAEALAAGDGLERWARELQTRKTYKHAQAERLRRAVPRLIVATGWRKAERFQEEGRAGDTSAFVRCGQQYIAVHNEFPDHPSADILVFNAARCFEAGLSLGNAIRMRRLMLARYPDSKLYQQTLFELAETYQAIVQFGPAATHLERYAQQFPKDRQAESALHNAAIFRFGLGDKAAGRANLDRYERLYRRKNPKKAAGIFWTHHKRIESDVEQLAHARQYLKTYGSKGGVDRRVVAEATIGQILWRQSCSRRLPYDSCVAIERAKPTTAHQRWMGKRPTGRKGVAPVPRQCGLASGDVVTVHARDKRKAERAQAHFAVVRKLAASKPQIPREDSARVSAYNDAVAMAMVYEADREYEAYLQVQLPAGLEFYVDPQHKYGTPKHAAQVAKKKESERRFREFFQRKTRGGQDLIERYAKLGEVRSPGWTLAGAARTAVLSGHFADQLGRADVPRSLKTQGQYDAYCGALEQASAGPRELAANAYATCLDWSTQLNYFNEHSRMCEEALHGVNPTKYPATLEALGTATYTRSVMDLVGVQTDSTLRADVLSVESSE